MIFSKGAPEIIISKCKYIDNDGTIEIITPEIKQTLSNKINEMTDNALRVIGFAYKTKDENPDEENLILTGLVGIIDPTKKSAKKAVADCKKAGIKVVMITGDHQKTATAIAKDLKILTTGKVITGEELDALSDEEYFEIVEDIQVYARVKPTQKMRIVETLKQKKNIVSMTGDGVNDAPALKKASIGVAMGNGTDVAREASDMIIEDNDFATIVKAIKEGRKIYDNIKRFVKFQVSTNVGAILTIIGTSLLSLPLPFNPAQLLWINIVMDGPPAQTLGLEGAEKDIMERKPKPKDEGIFAGGLGIRVVLQGLMFAVITLIGFKYGMNVTGSLEVGQTMAFAVLSLSQILQSFNMRSDRSIFKIGLFGNKTLNKAVLASLILVLIVLFSPIRISFGLEILSVKLYIVAIILVIIPTIIMEISKAIGLSLAFSFKSSSYW